jgi:hypothetical protein
MLDGFSNDPGIRGRSLGRQRLIPHKGCQVGTIDIIHYQKVLPVVNPHFMNGYNVRMMQSACDDSFGAEAPDHCLASHGTEEQHFNGDNSVETFLTSLINNPHPTLRDFLQKFVIAKRPWRIESSGAWKRLLAGIRHLEIA